MSKNTHTARHRATPVRTSPLRSVSKAVSTNAGNIGRPVAVLAAASAMMLGVVAPAQASATANQPAAATAAPAAGYTANAGAATGSASTHTVQSGDTLGKIAAMHGISLSTLLSLNGLSMNSIIYPGDTIALSGSGNTAVAATVSASASVATPAPAPAPAPAAKAASSTSSSSASNVSLASSGYTEIPASSMNAAILASARAQIGAVQDCTVLGEQALRAAGISGVGDESPESLMGYATQVSNPQPGDFIYYADGGMGFSHNAVYIGGGKAIHSGWNGNQTVVKSVDVGSGPVYYRVNG